jgi:hypothetical protein
VHAASFGIGISLVVASHLLLGGCSANDAGITTDIDGNRAGSVSGGSGENSSSNVRAPTTPSTVGGGAPKSDAGAGPADGLRIGVWLSPWVLGMRTPQQWVKGIKGLSNASSYPNRAVVVITMCGAATQQTSQCLFAQPPGVPSYPNVEYGADQVTPILDAIEADGSIDVILDVEPMEAHVSDLMRVVMTKYGGDGDKVAKLPGWRDELHTYKPNMEFHLIGFDKNTFGTYRGDSLSFGYDGQGFGGLDSMLGYFTDWSSHFAPKRVGWYWGYATDASWLRPLLTSPEALRDLHDKLHAINPKGTILMATEALYFEVDGMFPSAPMR